jgi:hypothetical protein
MLQLNGEYIKTLKLLYWPEVNYIPVWFFKKLKVSILV